MTFYYVSLGIIFLVSGLIVREDMRNKKIRNKWIMLGFVLGLFLLFISFVLGGIGVDYLAKVGINTLVSLAVGFVIWRLGFWPAGDGKFFTLLAFLLPLHYYWKTYLDHFPAIIILINTFVSFLVFLIFKSVFFFLRHLIGFLIKSRRKIRTKIFLIIGIRLAEKRKEVKDLLDNKKFLAKLVFKIAPSFLFYFLITKFYFKRNFDWRVLFGSLTIFWLITKLLEFYTERHTKEAIAVSELKEKMNLDEKLKAKFKQDRDIYKKLGTFRAEGLGSEQINLIKRYFRENYIMKICVYKTVPFSLWLVIGVVLTILFEGSMMLIFY